MRCPPSPVLAKTKTYAATLHAEVLLNLPKRPYNIFVILDEHYGMPPAELNARLAHKASEIGIDAVVICPVNDKSVTNWLLADHYYGVYDYSHSRCRSVKQAHRRVRAKALQHTK